MRNLHIPAAVLLMVLFVVFQQSASAQQQVPMQGQEKSAKALTPEDRAKELQEQLALTDEQVAQVVKIYEGAQKKRMELNSTSMSDRGASQKALQELTAREDKEIEALLTKEQVEKYAEMKKKRQQQKPIWQ